MKKLEEYVVSIPDFPEPGIIFRDVTSILQDADGLALAIDSIREMVKDLDYDVVVGPESRGFIFGVPVAYAEHKSFVPIRKKGKLPRKTIGAQYALEYGTDSLYMHSDDVDKNDRVVILDDILATGGTAGAMCELAEICGAQIACCAFFMELEFLRGRNKLGSRHVITLVKK